MAANPRMVTKNITVAWDGGTFPVTAGTVVDIPAGGSLETAYGAGNLVSLTQQQLGSDEDTEPIFAEG
jgi:hypothetical protein